MSIQESVNRIIGSVTGGVSQIQTGIERGEKTENMKKEIGLQKQQIWSQKGQLARMKKANERIRERQEVLKQQNKELKKLKDTKQKEMDEKVTIGGTLIPPTHPLYKTLMGGNNGK